MQELLVQLFSGHAILAPVIFIIARSLAIIIPPIPGIAIDLPGILVFGWLVGFIYAEIGIMLGAMVAFWIARKFKEPLLKKFITLQKIRKLEDKISDNQEFWALTATRLLTNPLFDYISYAAGLTRISTTKFFFSTLIGNIPTLLFIYYFGGFALDRGVYYIVAFVALLVALWIILKNVGLKKIFNSDSS